MKNKPYSTGSRWQSKNNSTEVKSAENKAYDIFAEIMIERIKEIDKDWTKPWTNAQGSMYPRNISGRKYNGMNALMLMFLSQKYNYKTPFFGTFLSISDLNYTKHSDGTKSPKVNENGEKLPNIHINKGAVSFPVLLSMPNFYNLETKEKISIDDYKNLTDEEKKDYGVRFTVKVYNVFNLDQTNMAEVRPELYQKFLDLAQGNVELRDENDMFSFPQVDVLMRDNLYICPIKTALSNEAYYSLSKDEIIVPEKKQFVSGEAFYSTLLHEMAHATGREDIFDRFGERGCFGSKVYAKEELTAELTSAVVAAQYGFDKSVKDESCAYLKSWLNHIEEDPDFIKTVLKDVKKSSEFICNEIEKAQRVIDKETTENIDLKGDEIENESNFVGVDLDADGCLETNECNEEKTRHHKFR